MARSQTSSGHGHQPNAKAYSRECRGKICYTSKKQANGVRRVMLARGRGDAATLNAYSCSVCRSWHLGNSNRKDAA